MRARGAGAAATALLLAACAPTTGPEPEAAWTPLFDGRSLAGWTPKLRGHPLGDNHRDTFRVRDGAIAVSYDGYDQFGERFGHLFHERRLCAFRLRLEYRFLTSGTPADTPGWAIANSGVMIHAQDPASMAAGDAFPVSIEAQLLGPVAGETRTNGNLCTPGTNVEMNGALVTTHCINSALPARPNGEWRRFEIEVTPEGRVTHVVDGAVAISYSAPQLDPEGRMADSKPLVAAAGGALGLSCGHIALQSEGAPIEFRAIEVLELDTVD